MPKLVNVGRIAPRGLSPLKPIGRLTQPAGRLLAPITERAKPLGEEAITRGEQHVREQLDEILPDLSEDLSEDEKGQIDEALEGILTVVGELDTDAAEQVRSACADIYHKTHGPRRRPSSRAEPLGEEPPEAGNVVDVIGLEQAEVGAIGGGYRSRPGEWR